MVKTYNYPEGNGWNKFVKEDDYLKVVEENEYLKQQDKERETTINNYEKSSKEKDKEIEKLKEQIKEPQLNRITSYVLEKGWAKEGLVSYVVIELFEKMDKELKGLDIRCESLEEENEVLRNNSNELFELTKFISEERNCYGRAGESSVKVAIETIKELEKQLEEKEETWTLRYLVDINGKEKEVVQMGMLKDDAHELIGMDCDNWLSWGMEKEGRE